MKDNIPEIGAEITAMKATYDAIAPLDETSRSRVLDWLFKVFVSSNTASPIRQPEATRKLSTSQPGALDSLAAEFTAVEDFFASVQTNTAAEKALVIAYYLQTKDTRNGVTGLEINSCLKNLGHPASNITITMNVLMNRRPQLIVQTGKEGSAQQARKTYKVTIEGMREVQRLRELHNASTQG